MAARKSCTHMTWAEAKAKSGVGGSKGGGGGTKLPPKRENHGKLLAAKIVAKSGPSESERIENRQAARKAKRDQQRQEQLDAQREAEKEQQRLEAVVRPVDVAAERLEELALKCQEKSIESQSDADVQGSIMEHCECKQQQMDELLALEAIYADTNVLTVREASQVQVLLGELLEEWQNDPDQEEGQQAVADHPLLSYTLSRVQDDPAEEDWVAHVLLEVTCPKDYPLLVTPPSISIVWFCLTQKSLIVSDNKPLESMGELDETSLLQALNEQAQDLLGMPAVYELLDTWMEEHLFEYITRTVT